jgi:hypothetical protein
MLSRLMQFCSDFAFCSFCSLMLLQLTLLQFADALQLLQEWALPKEALHVSDSIIIRFKRWHPKAVSDLFGFDIGLGTVHSCHTNLDFCG